MDEIPHYSYRLSITEMRWTDRKLYSYRSWISTYGNTGTTSGDSIFNNDIYFQTCEWLVSNWLPCLEQPSLGTNSAKRGSTKEGGAGLSSSTLLTSTDNSDGWVGGGRVVSKVILTEWGWWCLPHEGPNQVPSQIHCCLAFCKHTGTKVVCHMWCGGRVFVTDVVYSRKYRTQSILTSHLSAAVS